MTSFSKDIDLPTEDATTAFAQVIAEILRIGDTLLLEGPIGAGKSFFSRALIRARTATQEDIPSPTFTIVQTYQHPTGDIWHCDLYRLTNLDEAIELGLDDAFETAICLIEWPDRLGNATPQNALKLHFRASPDGHAANISYTGEWRDRLANLDV